MKSSDEGERFHGEKGRERYFVNFLEGEFEGYLPGDFEMTRYAVTAFGRTFLNFHLKKRQGEEVSG